MTRRRSKTWLRERADDSFVKRAGREGYRSRAAYKLLAIDSKYRLLRPGATVIDLGASPGGWSQVARKQVGCGGRVIALDMLAMKPLPGIEFLQGDFTGPEALGGLLDTLAGDSVSLVMSDMAPNISGIRAVDQARAMYLAELTLELGIKVLTPGGALVVKVFQGEGFEAYFTTLRTRFDRVKACKPEASRSRSRETYLVATGYA